MASLLDRIEALEGVLGAEKNPLAYIRIKGVDCRAGVPARDDERDCIGVTAGVVSVPRKPGESLAELCRRAVDIVPSQRRRSVPVFSSIYAVQAAGVQHGAR